MDTAPKSSAGQLGFTFERVPPSQPRRVWKVSEVAAELRGEIEREFRDLWIEGEICDLRPAASGHIYFTLKDESAQLSTVLFRRQATLLRFRPENGLHILLRGKLSVYEQRGQVQIIAEHIEPVGAGSLQLAFEQVKRQLQREGLFEAERKRPLPAYPRCVGIVTSPAGAVIRDIVTIVARRHSSLQLLIYPALVQGEGAAAEVIEGIAWFNRTREVDLIVIARGGGSLEDLTPFNSELLARAIAASELPIVSAVGHESDFTIADLVADLRAPTPSAAAEIVTGAQHQIEERLNQLTHRLERATRYQLMQARETFTRISADAVLSSLTGALHRRQQRLDELAFRMEAAWHLTTRGASQRLQTARVALERNDVALRIGRVRERLSDLHARLLRAQEMGSRAARARILSLERQLVSLSPLGVLSRGYALVYAESGELLRSASAAAPGQILTTRLADGMIESRVTETALRQVSR